MNETCALSFILSSAAFFWRENCLRISTPISSLREEYDFIIVGGGTAGTVLAARLTELSDFNVLLLESGGSDSDAADVPATYNYLTESVVTNRLRTVPQKNVCQSAPDKKCVLETGHVLGGGSTSGARCYCRGSPAVYDEWASLGATGWAYNDVLKYFIKAENVSDPTLRSSPFHGTSGPQSVSRSQPTPLVRRFLNSARELGLRSGDYNGQFPNSFSVNQLFSRRAQQWSTQRGYLEPSLGRKNLNVLCFAHAKRILFEGNRAAGVEFYYQNETRTVTASKEVILSAGTLYSPQMLMVSGIGPKDVLNRLKIPLVSPLPGVGQNFQKMEAVGLSFKSNYKSDFQRNLDFNDYFEYETNQTGRLSLDGKVGLGLVTTPHSKNGNDTRIALLFDDEPLGPRFDSQPQFSFSIFNVKPFSRGYVTIKSSDSLVEPVVDPRSQSNQEDRFTLKEGIKLVERMNATKAFREINAQVTLMSPKQCEHLVPFSEQFVECFLTNYLYNFTSFNFACTNKMGSSTDSMAVVSPKLKVYGVRNLRLVDSSVMPTYPGCYANAATIMVAEKAAHIIKMDYPSGSSGASNVGPSNAEPSTPGAVDSSTQSNHQELIFAEVLAVSIPVAQSVFV